MRSGPGETLEQERSREQKSGKASNEIEFRKITPQDLRCRRFHPFREDSRIDGSPPNPARTRKCAAASKSQRLAVIGDNISKSQYVGFGLRSEFTRLRDVAGPGKFRRIWISQRRECDLLI